MIALIGIILLIGIVKKNAIMMIDFALAAERNEGKRFGGCDLRGVHAALPADHDDHDGGDAWRAAAGAGNRTGIELRRPLGIAIVGGLIVSQMLTLFTTPVIYLYLDRFQLRLRSRREAKKAAKQPKEAATGCAGSRAELVERERQLGSAARRKLSTRGRGRPRHSNDMTGRTP